MRIVVTAPFGEELTVTRPTDKLAKDLKLFAKSPRQLLGRRYSSKVVSVLTVKGRKRTTWRHFAWLQRALWCGASHDIASESPLVRTPEHFRLIGFGNFACGVVVPTGELIVRLQYARDAERQFVQRLGARDVQYEWQLMPLSWLSPEEIVAISTSLHNLSSKARAH